MIIDPFRIARLSYIDEVTADAPLSWWRLGESSGTNAVATGSAPTNGTYTGGYTLGSTGLVTGSSDTAITLDGSTGYVDLGSPAALNLSRSFSVDAWIKPQGAPADRTIISFADSGFMLALAGTSFLTFYKSRVANIGANTGALADGVRHHVAFTIDASGLWALYVDGSVGASGTTALTFSGTSGLRIGADYNGSAVARFYNGVIDEVAIYGSTLSAARVTAHYAAGA